MPAARSIRHPWPFPTTTTLKAIAYNGTTADSSISTGVYQINSVVQVQASVRQEEVICQVTNFDNLRNSGSHYSLYDGWQ
jgi:hypothetical protein